MELHQDAHVHQPDGPSVGNTSEQPRVLVWFALHCKARCEAMVDQQLSEHGVETFYPRYRVWRGKGHGRRECPLFPGYLFARTNPDEMDPHLFRYLPGLIGVVRFDGRPARVPDELIAHIRQRVERIAEVGSPALLDLQQGDTVRILEGPFKDLEAVFQGTLDGKGRVRVLLEVLGRLSRVELPADQIAKVHAVESRPARLRRTRGRGRPCRHLP